MSFDCDRTLYIYPLSGESGSYEMYDSHVDEVESMIGDHVGCDPGDVLATAEFLEQEGQIKMRRFKVAGEYAGAYCVVLDVLDGE